MPKEVSRILQITSQGKKAADFTKNQVKPGDIIKIEFDIQQRDKYGRILGYAYLSNGKMLNEEIIKTEPNPPIRYIVAVFAVIKSCYRDQKPVIRILCGSI